MDSETVLLGAKVSDTLQRPSASHLTSWYLTPSIERDFFLHIPLIKK